ncbi:histidine kinase [Streptomyces sp. SID3343]|uniref:sensor histidine kinase n=1 Tax=Streptomyces sp. SID3343 TaxID=2690260 RepID=UPI001369D0C1|nr:histidine kinase [Streptomyces sp. SID3343]MYW04857.1 sensor histidine kinase [Streptomyces sp. SID3343]
MYQHAHEGQAERGADRHVRGRAKHTLDLVRRTNPYVVDGAIALLVQILVMLPCVVALKSPYRLGFLFLTGTAIPLIWRRRFPLTVAFIVALFTMQVSLLHRPGQSFPFGLTIAIYTVFAIGRRWQQVFITALTLPISLIIEYVRHKPPQQATFDILTLAAAAAFGMAARQRQAYIASIEERTRRLEHERDLEARRADAEVARAAARERARIARDMHDILAHAVSLMTVQAEAGPVVVRSDPARAEAAFDAIADAGRDAMVQLRRILGTLKEDDDLGARAPQPTVGNIADLVTEVGRTGLRAVYESVGERRPLPSDAQIAAYRVVQEALTNAVRHARATHVRVRLEWGEDTMTATITDDGCGGKPRPGGGHGLVGIRERAAACGGHVTAGPRPGGRGFEVVLRVPLFERGGVR